MIIYLIGVILSIVISVITIYSHIKRFYNLKIKFLIISTIFLINYGIIYPLLKYISLIAIFKVDFTLLLWRISSNLLICSGILIIIGIETLDLKRFHLFLNLIIFSLSGYIISLTLMDETFIISTLIIDSLSYYVVEISFNYLISGIILLIFILLKLNYNFLSVLKFKTKKRRLRVYYIIPNTMIILMITFYLILQYLNPYLFSSFSLLFNWIGVLFSYYVFLKYYTKYLSFFNIAYEFVVFHKSGIMLFSYDFEKNERKETSTIKGAVLIGINHILSEFSTAKDQITSIKLKDREIILEYNREYGFAILLIVNKSTNVFKKATQSFMKQFIGKYKNELKSYMDLNTAIDTSAFDDANNILLKTFECVPSLSNNSNK